MLRTLIMLSLLTASITSQAANAPKVKEFGKGKYMQDLGKYFGHIVEIEIQTCYSFYHESLTKIDCKDLYKRDEWKPILTWVK